jgi:hypothetical protein
MERDRTRRPHQRHTAWIAYVNKGSITDASGTMNQKWWESAFLEKQAGTGRSSSCTAPASPWRLKKTIANDIETLEAQTALIASLVESKFTDLQPASLVNLASLQTKGSLSTQLIEHTR